MNKDKIMDAYGLYTNILYHFDSMLMCYIGIVGIRNCTPVMYTKKKKKKQFPRLEN